MTEIWKDIPGYEGLYQVSNFGRIASMAKTWISGNGKSQTMDWKILIQTIVMGYCKVGLHYRAKCKGSAVHRLVALAFIPNVENKPEVNQEQV